MTQSIDSAIVILADGARSDVFHRLLSENKLPHIASNILDRGTFVPAVTSFPSTTGPAYLPYLTGCLPGSCNMPGIRWFDKSLYGKGHSFHRYRSYVGLESFWMASDITSHIRTIFELLPDSYNVFNAITRGAGSRNMTTISRIWYWYYAHLTDHWGYIDHVAMDKVIQTLDKDPSYIFAVFPAIDEYSHLSHPEHDSVINAYVALDNHIGKLYNALDKKNIRESTAVFIVSDHGLSRTHTHFCINTFLEKHGLPVFFYPLIFNKKGKRAASMVSGNGMSHVYFQHPDGWDQRVCKSMIDYMAPNLISELVKEPAIDIITLYEDEQTLLILSKRGKATLAWDEDAIVYNVCDNDPFGYGVLPVRMSKEESLQQTAGTNYPDALFQLLHITNASRSGDMILSAMPGYDLRLKYEHPEHFASHGSLHALHMNVPLISSVQLPQKPVRSVDLFPTIFSLLGHHAPDYIDGQSLLRD